MHNQDVVDYLAAQQNIWTPSTVKAAASRLKHYSPCQDALKGYNKMISEGYSRYYIQIVFISMASLKDWLQAQGRANSNPYRDFLQTNKHLFRNAYEDKYATITWEEFEAELTIAPAELVPALALMGYAGCRLSELTTFDGTTVIGKGGKRRPVFLPDRFRDLRVRMPSYSIYRRLKHNPHSYRKLAADKWLRSGVDLKTVQKLLGHTSLASTQRYLRPLQDEALNLKLQEVWNTV